MIFFKKKKEDNIKKSITEEERIKGCLYGFFVGDALGVPVEFLNRGVLFNNPIKQMEEYGTHNQPKGTWSDDSSMVLATIDSMINNKELLLTDEIINYNDLMNKFSNWKSKGEYTPNNSVFDIGISTSSAISKFENTNNPFSGDNSINSNGNGSLMRILPVSIFTHYCIHQTYEYTIKDDFYNLVKNISSLTHSHDLSVMSCMIYTYFIDNYLETFDLKRTYDRTRQHFKNIFEGKIKKNYGDNTLYKEYFNRLIYNDISLLSLDEIKSSGFVIDSLEATLWCILTTNSYKEATLKATGASGVVYKGNGVQIIYGPHVTVIKSNLEEYLESAPDVEEVAEETVQEEVKNETSLENMKVVETIIISSPITGKAAALEQAPDEVFAGKMLGDGGTVLPIDGVVVAPEDGEIGFIFDTKHAVGFITDSGVELLIHMGIDTVKLNGEGFEVLAEAGQKVKKGTPILKLDLDYIKKNAPSLVSPVICTELPENKKVRMLAKGNVKKGEALLAVDIYA